MLVIVTFSVAWRLCQLVIVSSLSLQKRSFHHSFLVSLLDCWCVDSKYSWKWWEPEQQTGLYISQCTGQKGGNTLKKLPVHYNLSLINKQLQSHLISHLSYQILWGGCPLQSLDSGWMLMLPTCRLQRKDWVSPTDRCVRVWIVASCRNTHWYDVRLKISFHSDEPATWWLLSGPMEHHQYYL